MSGGPELDRRRFVGLSAATLAGGGALVAALARGSRGTLAWAEEAGAPEAPQVLIARALDGLPDGTRLPVRLRVETPDGAVELGAVGALEVSGGTARGEVPLRYPFDRRVAGGYAYHAEIEVGGRRVTTTSPARYSVRRLALFS